jgi:deoxyribodipyrimidine photo-lyase
MTHFFPSDHKLIPFNYAPLHILHATLHSESSLSLEILGFTPQILTTAQLSSPEEKLSIFGKKIENYSKHRDYMALEGTSGLSSDLRFGTISIRKVLRWLVTQKQSGVDTEPFFRQLIFRDFYAMLLYHFPHLSQQNFRYPFKGIADETYFHAFCTAQTGVPIVDAGIEELLQSGEMHNRIRMICASFFTKNLLLPWQWGETFFAEHLNDYDAASNILSWQWSAGTGVDPQPYFRIFNPYTQTSKFDSNGTYIYKWLPRLSNVAPKTLCNENLLTLLSLSNYPHPIVNHKSSSHRALTYFKAFQN